MLSISFICFYIFSLSCFLVLFAFFHLIRIRWFRNTSLRYTQTVHKARRTNIFINENISIWIVWRSASRLYSSSKLFWQMVVVIEVIVDAIVSTACIIHSDSVLKTISNIKKCTNIHTRRVGDKNNNKKRK